MNKSLARTNPKLLKVFENLKHSIAEIDDIQELFSLRNQADGFEKAWKGYYKSSGFGFEQMFLGWETKVRSERKMGKMLGEMKLQGSNQWKLHHETSLENLGISKIQSFRYQQIARLEKEKFDKKIEELRLSWTEPTTKLMLLIAHVGHSTGEDEWYTPPEYASAASKTMGGIDLDPASTEIANLGVGAKKHYTKDDNGLEQEWFGNVWMNPPYSQPLISQFSTRLVEDYAKQDIKQACVLVNNATETNWYQRMIKACSVVCFLKGRVKFIDKHGKESGTPLQGQTILYFGKNVKKFNENFKKFGTILWNKGAK